MSEAELRAPLLLRRADRQPPRRHRAAAGALRDRAARLPRDRPGPASGRAARGASVHARLPRAARRFLHLRRELRPARVRPAGVRPLHVPSHAPAGRHRLLARRRRRLGRSTPRSATGGSRGATSPSTASGTAGARTRSSASSWPCPRSRGATSSLRCRAIRRRTASCSRAVAGVCGRPSTSRPTSTPTATTSAARAASSPSPRTRTSDCARAGSATARATYLAAGRPVVTQDTGFGRVLPTGEALFPFTIDRRRRRPRSRRSRPTTRRRGRRHSTLAREHFDSDVVLGRLLDTVGVTLPASADGRRSFPRPSISCPSRGGRRCCAETHPRGSAQPPDPRDRRRPARTPSTRRLGRCRRARRPRLHAALPRERPAERRRRRSRSRSWSTTARPTGRASTSPRSPSATRACVVLRNDENRGFAPGRQPGSGAANGDVLVVLNNDTIVPPGWLSRLVGASRATGDRTRRPDHEPLRQRGRGRRPVPHLW